MNLNILTLAIAIRTHAFGYLSSISNYSILFCPTDKHDKWHFPFECVRNIFCSCVCVFYFLLATKIIISSGTIAFSENGNKFLWFYFDLSFRISMIAWVTYKFIIYRQYCSHNQMKIQWGLRLLKWKFYDFQTHAFASSNNIRQMQAVN